jgi:hypothetical protein
MEKKTTASQASTTQPKLVRNFSSDATTSSNVLTGKTMFLFLALLVLGITTGYFLSTRGPSAPVMVNQAGEEGSTTVSKGDTIGSEDTETFSDDVEGVVKEGGIEGEGQYHLERPGGESQFVYMTSSIVDLSQFEGKKVKVWGKTYEGEKAGWLMDVGRVQLLE